MSSYRQKRALLMGFTACIWFAAIAVSVQKFKLAAKAGIKISLQTSPGTVKIFVNNQPEFEGHYVQTPVTFFVPAGKHRIKIQREGFASQVVTVTGTFGDTYDMPAVVLGPLADVQLGAVRIETRLDLPGTSFAISSGLASGDIPADVVDLVTGREYELTVSAQTPSGKKSHRCTFVVAENATVDAPQILTLTRKGSRLRVTGCGPAGSQPKRSSPLQTENPSPSLSPSSAPEIPPVGTPQ